MKKIINLIKIISQPRNNSKELIYRMIRSSTCQQCLPQWPRSKVAKDTKPPL